MIRLLRLAREHLGLGVWSLVIWAFGFLPGFGGPTYPLSIVVGVAIGPIGAVVAANYAARLIARCLTDQKAALEVDAARLLLGCMGRSGLLFLLAFGAALGHGVVRGFCDPVGDGVRWLLGPGAGALAAGVWGAVIGRACWQHSKRRWALAVALPLASYAFSFGRFYTSPMVFAFDHFVGYFAGTLYDTELGTLERLWTYRLATLGFMSCGAWWLACVRITRLSLRVRGSALSCLWLASGALAAGVVTARGSEFGHYQTAADVDAALHHSADSERCVVRFGVGVSEAGAALLARECSAHVRELEQFFDVAAPPTIRVYLFQSADQKAWFMGARHVYIAKPWREEIYIQVAGFPHPVLRHELAHVVAGKLGQGPFRVAGSGGGLVPDPGRIEGFAVAAAPDEDEPLTSHQWAAAMKRLGLLPALGDLFQLGFFASNSSTAYTVAGAFVAWVRETFGVAALQAWYGGSSLEQATGVAPAQLEQRFLGALDAVALNEAELAAAAARFDRPAVLARKCPYKVDAALGEGLGLVAAGECADATRVLREVLALDPSALRAELGLGQCLQGRGAFDAARERFAEVANRPGVHALFRAAALERLGDVAWLARNLAEAEAHYQAAGELIVEEERLRQLDVKRLGVTAKDERAERAVASVFFARDGRGSAPVATGFELGQWVASSDAALGHYLLGKQLWGIADWAGAFVHLRQAARAPDLPARVTREAWRGVLVAACALGDAAAVAEVNEAVSRRAAFASARPAWLALASRCSHGAAAGAP